MLLLGFRTIPSTDAHITGRGVSVEKILACLLPPLSLVAEPDCEPVHGLRAVRFRAPGPASCERDRERAAQMRPLCS